MGSISVRGRGPGMPTEDRPRIFERFSRGNQLVARASVWVWRLLSRSSVMAQEDCDVLRFPTIAEDDELWALDSELGQYVFTR